MTYELAYSSEEMPPKKSRKKPSVLANRYEKVEVPPKKTKNPTVWANRYEMIDELGKGNTGTVYLCKDLRCNAEDTNEHLKVLKTIPQNEFESDETIEGMHEVRLLSKLKHPGIVQLHGSFTDGEHFCIVTEYCEGGDMHDVIQKRKESGRPFDVKTIIEWFMQLLTAVHYMHGQQVLHRCLKLRKIFLKENRLKIGGFGNSKVLMDASDLTSTFIGSAMYMSPEMAKYQGYNFKAKADIWALGCILYEICALKHVYTGKTLMAMMYQIVEGDPPNLPEIYPKELNRILHLMLTKEPEERPTAQELIAIPLIADNIGETGVQGHPEDHEWNDIPETVSSETNAQLSTGFNGQDFPTYFSEEDKPAFYCEEDKPTYHCDDDVPAGS